MAFNKSTITLWGIGPEHHPSTMTLFLRAFLFPARDSEYYDLYARCSSIELCINGFIYYNIVLSLAFS